MQSDLPKPRRGRPPIPHEQRALRTVSVRVTQDQRDALRDLAKERWTTVSDIIEMALDAFVDKAGYHPVVLNLPHDIHASLTKVAPQVGNKKDIHSVFMEAIAMYLASREPGDK